MDDISSGIWISMTFKIVGIFIFSTFLFFLVNHVLTFEVIGIFNFQI